MLRLSSIGMRRTSLIEWPAWLKCSDTGCWRFRRERRYVFPKAFTEMTLGVSDVLKVAPFTFYQVYEIF